MALILGRFYVRDDTAANWSSSNPVLALSELGYDTTNGILKIGDGSTAWNSLTTSFVKTPSTTSAVGVGTIELGHASDTTLSRSAAGVLAVEGNTVPVNTTSAVHTAGTIELGAATDTTLSRSSAGNLAIEGNVVYRAGGTDVSVADGGTGVSTLPSNQVLIGNGTSAVTGIGPSTAGYILGTSDGTTWAAQPLTRVNTTASSATPAINTDTTDQFTITALAAAITSMTSGLTGTPRDGQSLLIRIKDNGTARAITWGTSFVSSGVATLLATTVISKTHMIGLKYDSAAAKWVCMAVDATGY